MRKRSFTLVEIMIVVAIIGLLAAIAIPSFMRARGSAQANSCISNMRQIDTALQQYVIENNTTSLASADWWDDLGDYIDGTQKLTCPVDGGSYSVDGEEDNSFERVTCNDYGSTNDNGPLHVIPGQVSGT